MAADDSPEASGAMSARRASVTALAGVMGAVALLLLLVTWAATIGPDEVVRGEGNPPNYETLPTETVEPVESTSNRGSQGSGASPKVERVPIARPPALTNADPESPGTPGVTVYSGWDQPPSAASSPRLMPVWGES